jgi:choline dehydrogenase-like flavoprotein
MFLRSDPGLPAPDLQFMFIHVPFHPPTLEAPENSYTVAIVLIRPTSRGWVKLHSADSDAPPLINSNYLDDDADVRRLLLGIEKAHELHAADAFAEWRAREVLPGESPSEVDLRDFIARDANTYYHPVGSCRMGINEAAVVDPELKVHGLDGLRVADVCIMPTIVSANTNPSFIMIGATAADLVPGTVRGAGTVQTA